MHEKEIGRTTRADDARIGLAEQDAAAAQEARVVFGHVEQSREC